MRVLLTGASGFVGRAIATGLLDCGFEVIGVSRRGAGLPGLAQDICEDLCDSGWHEAVIKATARCDFIVHVAASLAMELDAPPVSLTNCVGTQSVVGLARAWKVRGLVYISSVPVIGLPMHLPITEEHPIDPPTAYHASKVFGEYLVNLFAREERGFGVSLRLTAPVGPSMPEDRMISNFARLAASGAPIVLNGGGGRAQNYVDVRDVAGAVANCLKRDYSGVLNIAGPEEISDMDLARLCVTTAGSRSSIGFSGRPDPQELVRWEVSIEKARRLIDYSPERGVQTVVRELTEFYASRAHQ